MKLPNIWKCEKPQYVKPNAVCPHDGKYIELLTLEELKSGDTERIVVSIFGEEVKAKDADTDTRFGFTAFGVLIKEESEND